VESKKISRLIAVFAAILILSGAAFVNRRALSGLFTKGPAPPPVEEIERRVRTILELPTYEHVYHNVIYLGEEARFLGIKHLDKRLLFSVNVAVRAGIDLRKGVHIEGTSTGTFRIGLPPPEILLVDADESSIREYFAKEFGGKISRLEYYDEIDKSKARTVEDAIERGILDAAGRQAKAIVEGLLLSLGLSEAYIYFRNGEAL
jgi:hypothetical protein